MEVQLVVANGSKAGLVIPIKVPKFFIGRADECHLKPKSDLVSRHHCVILVEEDYVAVRDFGSKNGTLLNGESVIGEQEMQSGDRLTVGQLEFDVKIAVVVKAEKKPKVKSVQEAVERTAENAVKAAKEDDLDLGDWLDSDDASSGADNVTRTQEVGTYITGDEDDTQEIAAASEETTGMPDRQEDTTQRVDAEHKKVEPKKIPKNTKANSRDAAADALRNFFRGR